MREWGWFDPIAGSFRQALSPLPDKRRGKNTRYRMEGLRSFAGTLLMAIDRTEYFSSSQIHCPQCSTRQLKSDETHYFHRVVTPVIVCPGQSPIIPLVPEFVVPQDGHDKQDCENAAA